MNKLVILIILSFLVLTCCKKEKQEEQEDPTIISCEITSPKDGEKIIKGTPCEIVVNATDGTVIISVEIFINDNLYETLTNEPYIFSWNTSTEEAGSYTIKSISTNINSETASDQITISLVEGTVPIPLFEADSLSSNKPPLTVKFTDNSLNYPTEWFWDFGDGETSTSKNPTHIYEKYGSYSVSLTVSNSYGSKTRYEEDFVKIISQGNSGDPCPNFEILNYEGKEYKTVQIGDQCWMAENLNVGEMVNGTSNMTDNNIIEKYCLQNSEEECDTYGGLYQWKELMNYSDNNQGICPVGWHIPSDEEWKILEGFADSQYSYPDPEWDSTDWRGFDAGKILKSKTGWYQAPVPSFGTDILNFGALPGGFRKYPSGMFQASGPLGYFWTSTTYDDNTAWGRLLSSSQYTLENNNKVTRYEWFSPLIIGQFEFRFQKYT